MALLHLVAKPRKAKELRAALAKLGLDDTRSLPGDRVLVKAEASDLSNLLGLKFSIEEHDRQLGPLRRATRRSILAEDARLVESIGRLVDRFYVPTPPDRLASDD